MLIIGLGNPGKKYQNTRHNAGYMVIDELEKQKPEGFILFKPDSFMNESGRAVKSLLRSLASHSEAKLLSKNLIVVHDDIDIPLGQFKIQKGRGAAGHKGVQSIINELKTKDFWRIRVGICPKRGKPENVEKFVLQKFTKEEQKITKEVIEKITKKLGSSPQLSE